MIVRVFVPKNTHVIMIQKIIKLSHDIILIFAKFKKLKYIQFTNIHNILINILDYKTI